MALLEINTGLLELSENVLDEGDAEVLTTKASIFVGGFDLEDAL